MATKSFYANEQIKQMIILMQRHLQEHTFTKVNESDVIRYCIEYAFKQHLDEHLLENSQE